MVELPGYAQVGEAAALATPWMTVSLIAFQTYLLIGLYLLAVRSGWGGVVCGSQRKQRGGDAPACS